MPPPPPVKLCAFHIYHPLMYMGWWSDGSARWTVTIKCAWIIVDYMYVIVTTNYIFKKFWPVLMSTILGELCTQVLSSASQHRWVIVKMSSYKYDETRLTEWFMKIFSKLVFRSYLNYFHITQHSQFSFTWDVK